MSGYSINQRTSHCRYKKISGISMKKMFILLTVTFFLLFSTAVGWSAETTDAEGKEKEAFYLKTTQDLVDLCSIDKGHPLYEKGIAFCYGYVTGAMNFYGAIAPSPKVPKIICSDHVIPRATMVQVFLDWANTAPQHLTEPPIDGLVRAAVDKWPCPKDK